MSAPNGRGRAAQMENGSRDPSERDRERARLAADVEAFLRRGGRIEEVATGAMAQAQGANPLRRTPAQSRGLTDD